MGCCYAFDITRIYTVCITTLGCVLSHQRPSRCGACNCCPCSGLRRFSPPLAGALTGAPCSISTPPQHATSWGGRRHRQPSADCLQVGGGSRGPPCRAARLVFSATRPAATGHPRGRLLVSRLDPLAAGCSLTCPLPIGSISGVRIRSGATGGLSMPRRSREQAVLKLRNAELEPSRGSPCPRLHD